MCRAFKDDRGDRNKKLIEVLAWQYGEEWKEAREYFHTVCKVEARDKGLEASCESCEFVECRYRQPGMEGDNREIFRLIWFSPAVWLQTPMGGGPYALNWPMVFEIAEILGIEIDNAMTEKIRLYEKTTLAHLGNRNEEEGN